MEEWIKYTDTSLYDGWVLEFNASTKEIIWREHYMVERISPEQKEEIELKISKYFINDKQIN